MRTVCNILSIAKKEYVEKPYDISDPKSYQEYCNSNPSKSSVMITLNKANLVADLPNLLTYICRDQKIENLYPTDPESTELRARIDELLQLN